LEKICKH